jgi:hypothetical protein
MRDGLCVLVALVASHAVLPSAARAIVFCASRKHPDRITVRGASCTKKEDSVPLPTGPTGPKGDQGDAGVPGSARAYAVVRHDGTFDAARTKNIVSVRHSAVAPTGVWCLTPAAGIDPTTTPAVASIDFNDVVTGIADHALVRSDAQPDCSPGEFEVITANDGGTSYSFANRGFVLLVP